MYSDRLFLKALIIMLMRHLRKVHELLAVLAEPTAEMETLRALLTEQGRYPARRTWERRLEAIPDTLPAQIGCLGRHLVALIQPWVACWPVDITPRVFVSQAPFQSRLRYCRYPKNRLTARDSDSCALRDADVPDVAQVPTWLPVNGDLVVVLSGIVEIALGVALTFLVKQRVLVGLAVAAFFVLIFPGNIAQYVNRIDAFGLNTDQARFTRLFFQPVLMAWALWSTGAWRALFTRKAQSA